MDADENLGLDWDGRTPRTCPERRHRGRAGHRGADLRDGGESVAEGDMVEMYAPLDEPLTEGETSGGTGAPAGPAGWQVVMAPGYTGKPSGSPWLPERQAASMRRARTCTASAATTTT